MTDSIRKQLEYLNSRAHRAVRRELDAAELEAINAAVQDGGLTLMQRVTLRLKLFLEHETPVMLPYSRIQGQRTLVSFPRIYTPSEWETISKEHYIHEKGKVCNVACDYGAVLSEGLEGRRLRLLKARELPGADADYVSCTLQTIDYVEAFADRYASAMEQAGREDDAVALRRAVRFGADGLYSALQVFRILHFTLWAAGNYHNTVGRFDQYAYPFYRADVEAGKLDRDGALELIEDFFLSFNWDSDLYYSLQWGDDGQSLVLGGLTPQGGPAVNELTELCLRASLELKQIDPKINLRVDKNTPFELYQLGTELTKVGMGFPQYSNDDVVVPGLMRLGYAPEHARNYVMAACWEFIVPSVAMDIPNIGAVPLAEVVNGVIRAEIDRCHTLDELLEKVKEALHGYARNLAAGLKNLYLEPAPFQSLLMGDCVDQGQDISRGSLYNNYGFHGTGFSCAVDQLAAVGKLVYEDGSISSERLIKALDNNFEGDAELRHTLRVHAPKIGRDDYAYRIGNELLGMFARSLEGMKNERGGIFRGGTGSAMYYLWHSANLPATADGRGAGEPLPANFSPSLFLTGSGILSVISAFAMDSLPLAVNGGPLTVELHDTVFRSEDSVGKVAQLVQAYVLKGGHQMQLNAVNREKLLDAQKRPEDHGDLIVRVWGWSGHFVELDKSYQDQIISRVEFGL